MLGWEADPRSLTAASTSCRTPTSTSDAPAAAPAVVVVVVTGPEGRGTPPARPSATTTGRERSGSWSGSPPSSSPPGRPLLTTPASTGHRPLPRKSRRGSATEAGTARPGRTGRVGIGPRFVSRARVRTPGTAAAWIRCLPKGSIPGWPRWTTRGRWSTFTGNRSEFGSCCSPSSCVLLIL